MQSNREEIYPLTSLRFFAATLVFVEHLQMIPGLEWVGFKAGIFGKIGVSVFFTLSGFILTYAHGAQNWAAEFGENTRKFYWSRFARIYPLHWLMFLVALPLGLNSSTARVSVADFPWLLTLTDRMWPGFTAGSQPDKVSWTLSVEFLFYFLAPLFFWFLYRRKNPLAILGLMISCCTVIITLAMLFFPKLNLVAYCRLPEFLLGMAGFHLLKRVNLSRFAPGLILLGIILLTAAAISDNRNDWNFYFFGYAPGSLITIVGFASLNGGLRTFFSNRRLVLLGNASFALYLFHDPVLRYTKVLLNRSNIVLPPFADILAGLVLFAGTLVGSVLLYQLYENPIRLKLRRFVEKAPVSHRASQQSNIKISVD